MAGAVEISGLGPLLAALGDFPKEISEELSKASDASLLLLVADLKQYPAPPPGSRYRRRKVTGISGAWDRALPAFEMTADAFEGTLVNELPETVWVQDEELQAAIHRGRWPTAQYILDQHRDDIEAHFEAAAARAAARIGGQR